MFGNCFKKLRCDNYCFGDPPRLALVETCTYKTTTDAIIIFSFLEKEQMYYYLSRVDKKKTRSSTLEIDCLDNFLISVKKKRRHVKENHCK